MKKRWLSILLVCGMLLTTLPSAVFAEGEDGAECVCTTACTAEVRNADCPTCGAEDAALEDCAQYKGEQENEPNDTQELAGPQEKAQEEPKVTEPAEEPTAPAKSQVAVQAVANNKAVAVQAEHKHCACGGSINAGGHTSHSDVAYTAWNGTSGIKYDNKTAYVYLTGNATMNSDLVVDGNTLYLCLNGKTLSSNGEKKIKVRNNARLVLCDCSGGGTIKGATKDVWGGACVYLYTSTFDMFGGKLTEGKVTGKGGGGAIALDDPQCVFNMYGGEISKNDGNKAGGAIFRTFGSGVNTAGGTFNMYGGTIKDNKAQNGGAFYSVTASKVNLAGGTISGNQSTSTTNNDYSGGGAIYLRGGGTLTISGTQITGNSAKKDGGAIFTGCRNFTISGSATLAGNTAGRRGGAICLYSDTGLDAKLDMTGGTISGNNATNDGGGVYVGKKGTLTLTGNAVFTGNKAKWGGGIYLTDNSSLTMTSGKLAQNNASEQGGGVFSYSDSSSFSLSGGTIESNTAGKNGGAVYINKGALNISGNPVVNGNTVSNKANNVELNSGKTLTIDGSMTDGASIGITTANKSYPVVFSNAYGQNYETLFFADDTANAHVEYNDDQKLQLAAGAHKYNVAVTTEGSGTAQASAAKAAEGETVTLTATPDEGYHFKKWDVLSGDVTITGDTFAMPAENVSVKAIFEAHSFTTEKAEAQYLKAGSTCTEQAEYYKSCAVCGLSSKGTAGEATFFSGNILSHDYGAWTSNGDGTHTRVCARDASHTETKDCHGGTVTCTAKAICKDCGGAYGEMAAHDFTAEKAEEDYLKSPATCTTKAVYYKSCAACGKTSKGTDAEATFESGDVLGHDWGEPNYTWAQVPDGYMCEAYKKCNNCSCDVSDVAKVTYAVTKAPTCLNTGVGTYTATFSGAFGFPAQTKDVTLPAAGHDWDATEYTWTPTEDGYNCTAKRVCQKDKSHEETETVTAAYTVVTEPTCLTDGLGRYQASFAADWAEGASKDVPISALDHDWGAWKSNGDGTHTRICARDSSHTETDDCSGGTATCTELATCTTCGGTYGELAAHDFTAEVAEEDYLKSEATCTEAAVYYKSCTACGLASEDTFQSGDPLGHDYDTEWSQDETHHWHVCQRCQDIADLEAHTASGWITDKAATAKVDGEKHKECTVCGYLLETDTIPATGSKTKPGKKDNTKSSTKTRIKTNAPKTGDDSTLLLWMALLGVSGVGVTGVVRYGRKRKDNE